MGLTKRFHLDIEDKMILTLYKNNLEELIRIVNECKLDKYLITICTENTQNGVSGNHQYLSFGYNAIFRVQSYDDYDYIHSKLKFAYREFNSVEEFYRSN